MERRKKPFPEEIIHVVSDRPGESDFMAGAFAKRSLPLLSIAGSTGSLVAGCATGSRHFFGGFVNHLRVWWRGFFGSRLRINMVSTVVTNIINILVLALAYPVYLHFLGYELYGVWLSLGVVLVFAQLGDLGIRTAIVKLVAEAQGQEDMAAMGQYVLMALMLLTVSGSLVFLSILGLRTSIIQWFRFPGELTAIAQWLLPWIGLLSVYVLIVQALKAVVAGLGRMDLANAIETGGRVVTIVLSILLFFLGWKLESLLLASWLSHCGQHLAAILVIRRLSSLRILRRANLDRARFRAMIDFSALVFGGALVSMLLDPFNRMMIARCVGVSAIPVYDIVYRVANQLRSVVAEGMRPLLPELSRMANDGGRRERIGHVQRRLQGLVLLLIPLFLGLWWFSDAGFEFWLRQGYSSELAQAFGILLPGIWANLAGVPAYYTLMAMNRAGLCFIAHAIQALVNAALVLLAWNGFGMLDVSIVCAAVSVGYVLSTLFLLKHGRIPPHERHPGMVA
ncbi:MAG: oligosaccharide flippase family protein [Magnetococcales bacterium]|nr:oligosaccharide flippase family protein [Magnetococcales bacterium]